MEPFNTVIGVAAPLLLPNVDTDAIMPKQFLKGIDRTGLRAGFLYDLRCFPDGAPRPEFVLNQAPWADASFLVVGPNFGCGSSREHAVWGMRQFGIRAVIGTTYGGIFQDNCARNGVLTISLSPDEVEVLGRQASDPQANHLTVDLPSQSVTMVATGRSMHFDIDTLTKNALTQGLDAVAATLQDANTIRDFERSYLQSRPWLA
jgi:3-isopropylmalate/(R)-2-methylmalate dehydratase small subunit